MRDIVARRLIARAVLRGGRAARGEGAAQAFSEQHGITPGVEASLIGGTFLPDVALDPIWHLCARCVVQKPCTITRFCMFLGFPSMHARKFVHA